MGRTCGYVLASTVLLGGWLLVGSCSGSKTSATSNEVRRGTQQLIADNGLSPDDRKRFYTLPEGSELFPLSWFLRLESEQTKRPFAENLERFGLIYAEEGLNQYNLPIGLTYFEPEDVPVKMVGVNCAACHVGEIHYRDKPRLRIDGAPNMFDIDAFYRDLINSAVATLRSPSKLARLATPRLEVDAQLDAIGEIFGDLEALRVEGEMGARLAEAFVQLVDAERKRFEEDYRAHGQRLIASVLSGEPEPARTSGDVPYRGTFRRIIEELGERRHASQLGADAPLTKRAVESPRLLERWTAVFSGRVRLLQARIAFLQILASSQSNGTPPLHGRVDAFGSARNFLFGDKYGYTAKLAPIAFPHLWGFEKFAWLHWNANTNSVLERNMGQGLGLGAIVDTETWDSSLLFENLHELERVAYKIRPPKWPESMLGAIDMEKARAGQKLYDEHCARCHEQVTKTSEGLLDFPLYPLADIGTDPNHATEFARPVGDVSFADALQHTLGKIKEHYYEGHGVSAELQVAWEGTRKNIMWRSPLAYPARPLAGVWAVAPYLHNNSVPTLWHLLLPPKQRPTRFKVGDREYDPKHVGYVFELGSTSNENSIYDTRLTGNHNSGHDYGTGLSDAERWALIEYLKTK
jgi:hypothetical protein